MTRKTNMLWMVAAAAALAVTSSPVALSAADRAQARANVDRASGKRAAPANNRRPAVQPNNNRNNPNRNNANRNNANRNNDRNANNRRGNNNRVVAGNTVVVNQNVDRNYHGSYNDDYHHGHWDDDDDDFLEFVGKTAAVTAGVSITAAVIGSIVNDEPDDCQQIVSNGQTYLNCQGVWYQPTMAGTNVQYVVVEDPQ